jgi:hypothetical protein
MKPVVCDRSKVRQNERATEDIDGLGSNRELSLCLIEPRACGLQLQVVLLSKAPKTCALEYI